MYFGLILILLGEECYETIDYIPTNFIKKCNRHIFAYRKPNREQPKVLYKSLCTLGNKNSSQD
jgi:hypothetical protein